MIAIVAIGVIGTSIGTKRAALRQKRDEQAAARATG